MPRHGQYWVAQRLRPWPSGAKLVSELLGEGALTAAFIPIFKKKEVQDGRKRMWTVPQCGHFQPGHLRPVVTCWSW